MLADSFWRHSPAAGHSLRVDDCGMGQHKYLLTLKFRDIENCHFSHTKLERLCSTLPANWQHAPPRDIIISHTFYGLANPHAQPPHWERVRAVRLNFIILPFLAALVRAKCPRKIWDINSVIICGRIGGIRGTKLSHPFIRLQRDTPERRLAQFARNGSIRT